MALKSIVKVSHLSNLSDARFCSGMGVEMLGFGAIPGTERYMEPGLFHDIRGWIAGPRIIAEVYGITSADQLREVVETYAPDYFELTWEEYTTFKNDLTLPAIVQFTNVEAARGSRDANIAFIITDEATTCDDIDDIPYPALSRVRSVDALQSKLSAGCFSGFVLDGPPQVRAGITSYDELGVILEALEEE